MAMNKKPQLAKPVAIEKANNVAGENVPEYLHRPAGRGAAGLEFMGQQDMVLPRVALCQSMTPQRKKGDPAHIQGLEEGSFFNTVTQVIYGDKLRVVPLLFYKSRILFNPMEDGGGLRCQAPDARHGQGDPGGECDVCPMAQFGDDGRPRCSLFFNYAVIAIPHGGELSSENLAVLSLKSTGLKIARAWNALMRLRGVDSFAGLYELTSAVQKNSAGQSWFQPVVRNAGFVSRQEYEKARSAYEVIREAHASGRLAASEPARDEEEAAPAEM